MVPQESEEAEIRVAAINSALRRALESIAECVTEGHHAEICSFSAWGTIPEPQVWVSIADYDSFLALLDVGVMEVGSRVELEIQQATDEAGAGAKGFLGKAVQAIAGEDGGNQKARIAISASDLDQASGFSFIGFKITVTAGSVSQIGASIIGVYPKGIPADLPLRRAMRESIRGVLDEGRRLLGDSSAGTDMPQTLH